MPRRRSRMRAGQGNTGSVSGRPTRRTRRASSLPPRLRTPHHEGIFNQFYADAPDTPMRGFSIDWDFESKYDAAVTQPVHSFGWQSFARHPAKPNLSITGEWFAHLCEPSQGSDDEEDEGVSTVWVRGVEVEFSVASIRNFYGLPVVQDCIYRRLSSDKNNMEMFCARLCPLGHKSMGNQIDYQHLGWEARVWLRFINTRVFPTISYTSIGIDRAAFIYCVLNKLPIDLAQLLYDNMYHLAKSRVKRTYFSSFITEFCIEQHVPLLNDDMIGKCGTVFNERVLNTNQNPKKIEFVVRGDKKRQKVLTKLKEEDADDYAKGESWKSIFVQYTGQTYQRKKKVSLPTPSKPVSTSVPDIERAKAAKFIHDYLTKEGTIHETNDSRKKDFIQAFIDVRQPLSPVTKAADKGKEPMFPMSPSSSSLKEATTHFEVRQRIPNPQAEKSTPSQDIKNIYGILEGVRIEQGEQRQLLDRLLIDQVTMRTEMHQFFTRQCNSSFISTSAAGVQIDEPCPAQKHGGVGPFDDDGMFGGDTELEDDQSDDDGIILDHLIYVGNDDGILGGDTEPKDDQSDDGGIIPDHLAYVIISSDED